MESQIIQEILAGRQERFSSLMEKYWPLSLYYFHQRCRCDRETSMDLAQEAFFRAFQSLAQLQPCSSFKAWFMTICRNLVIDHLRRNSLASKAEKAGAEMADSSSPEAEVIKRLFIQEGIALLPERQREIIEQKYFWDLGVAEMAKIHGIPEGTVKSELYHARLRLLNYFNKEKSR